MKAKGPILLLITALLWGMAFVAQTQAANEVDPFTFNASRNFIGALFLTGVILVRKRLGQDRPPVPIRRGREGESRCRRGRSAVRAEGASSDVDPDSIPSETSDCRKSHPGASYSLGAYPRRTLLVGGFLCGIVLCASSFLQQSGISAYPDGAAASGRSGFVTATYMIMVAVFAMFMGKKAHPVVFGAVVVAMVGMYLLCVPNGFENVYWGDVLVLICAVGYALHIIVIDRFTQVDGVRLSRVQLIVAGSISLVGALLFENPEPAHIFAAIVPILYAGILSDGVAFTLQIIAQQTTDPTVASIIMSLESVFAALGGWVILGESLGVVELAGCSLVFLAVLMAQVPDWMENARKKSLEFKG